MTLGERQRRFTECIGRLILWAYENGFELSFGDAYRSPEQAALNAASGKGIKDSLHTKRLAVDFNLFVDGVFQQTTEAHKPLGDYWESLDPLCRWGGNFTTRKDGNHYELRDD